MKPPFTLLLSAGMLCAAAACSSPTPQQTTPPTVPAESVVHGVFEGITPCSRQARPLPQIPADTDCEQMIWKLVLYQDADTEMPTTYALNSAYGTPQQGTMGLIGGGTAVALDGHWTIETGTATDPGAVVYRLESGEAQTGVSFVKLDEDLLHVLAGDQTLLVGNASWSYTLNRTDNRAPVIVGEQPDSPYEDATRPPLPPMPAGSSVSGIFEGRTPCHAVVFEFTNVTPYAGCLKIKWKLTLYQEQTTAAPTTYLFQGTHTLRTGAWGTAQGTEGDPDAVVYRLQLDASGPAVSFLKADENHLFLLDEAMDFLVGDALFSYTLSRVD